MLVTEIVVGVTIGVVVEVRETAEVVVFAAADAEVRIRGVTMDKEDVVDDPPVVIVSVPTLCPLVWQSWLYSEQDRQNG